MLRTNRGSTLVLAGFTAFLAFFILALCYRRAAERTALCGVDPLVAAAYAAPEPRRALQVVTIAFADRPFCPARTAFR